jgi:hypothetical protein
MWKSKKIGPFTYVHCKKKKEGKHFIDISLTSLGDTPCGWQWGDDTTRDVKLHIELFGLTLAHWERWDGHWEIIILGFWVMK